ncbi:serine hydrolase [uncultured Tateyamaria sp.]|uniref:serine hydrolase domain-containing protein n=1 Tax=uncultured Tateyamaria sp. TaxID=455651 RepID=UPI00261999B7|nr:serine hydrolase [uncultured Tateyamaria sp.]
MQAFLGSILCVALLAPPHEAARETSQPVLHDAMQAAFDRWLNRQEATGALATARLGPEGVWESADKGAAPAELASVGKSVTAICTLHLVEEGVLDWSDSLAGLLVAAPDVTIGELVTHSSGIAPDATQAAMPLWLDQGQEATQHFSAQVLDLVNARSSQMGQRGRYQYNNENYALLGLVIEAVTNEPYFEACQTRLNLPDSIRPSPQTSEFQPWGGLMANPVDFAEFLHRHFGPGSAVADDPFAYPHVSLGDGAYYGLGMVFRGFRGGHNFWHFGAHCFPGRLNAGSYAVLWEGRMSAVAVFDACVEWDAMVELDYTLTVAAYGGRP